MASIKWGNQTAMTEFILLGFGNLKKLQTILFLLFLMIYIATIAGNILIIVLVVADVHLHTPMYFFLENLSCLEICYSSTILPRMLASFLTGDKTISVSSCILQHYLFAFLAGAECCLLSVMSYDRYVAICKPLHYVTLMNIRFCMHLAVGSRMCGFLVSTITTLSMLQLSFCGPQEIDHFLCDLPPVIKLSCSDIHLVKLIAFIFSFLFTIPPFLLTAASYISIITTILRIPLTTGRQKTFSTCSSHLIVVTVFYGTLIFVYMLPKSSALRDLSKVSSVFYTVLTPMINPLIYGLRNTNVKDALRNSVGKCMSYARI
ncbi:olfactory receptor 10A7-like [Alligator sinensis]|uniref:Olfactory receptor n=1 Tax=Alligator sinensis TaxID=38654 RepID=A0A1U8DPG1_ALLSI|nr:olfactory receptor 10A7-like [Alligator sinensis]